MEIKERTVENPVIRKTVEEVTSEVFAKTIEGLKKYYEVMVKDGLIQGYRITPDEKARRIFIDLEFSNPLQYIEVQMVETPS